MKIQPECVPCLLKRIIFEAEKSTQDKQLRKKVIKNTCKVLSDLYDPNVCSATIATEAHRIAYETLNDKDPYRELKDLSNKVAESLIPRVEELLEKSENPLKIAMICSIIGNIMDFGIEGTGDHPKILHDIFEKTLKEGLGFDDFKKVEKLLRKNKHVLIFTDNSGEIVFDKILCREIKKFNPNIFLSVVVRGEPIISDATIKDAKELHFEEIVDEILTTGCFAIGVDFSNLPKNLKNTIDETDLIICKGMANYEAFSETDYRPIAYLLRTKCTAISNSMELPININAIKVYE